MSEAQPQIRRKPAYSAPLPSDRLRVLGMNARRWQRHASPLSVYSRMATLPVLILAIWSHTWIGAGLAVLATSVVLLWLWLTPRLFPAPTTPHSWAAKATFGERVWLNRLVVPIPQDDARTALILSLVIAVGFLVAMLGALQTNLWLALTGLIVTYAGKLTFLDRMVSLYERMQNAHPLYRFWATMPDNDNRRGL